MQACKQRAFYTGTHDNNTIAGFIVENAEAIIGHNVESEKDTAVEAAAEDIFRKIYESPAALAMVQLQDIFMLGDDARMNTPGLIDGNWKWKIPGDSIRDAFPDADERAAWFRQLAEETDRR